MEKINITIDGKALTAEKGQTILEAAIAAGIEIPTLCHNKTVKVYGACGLCVVEADGIPKLLRSCSAKVSDGMVHSHPFKARRPIEKNRSRAHHERPRR